MIRRPPRSTQSRSSAASDVYKRQETTSQEITTTTPQLLLLHRLPRMFAQGRGLWRVQVPAFAAILRIASRTETISSSVLLCPMLMRTRPICNVPTTRGASGEQWSPARAAMSKALSKMKAVSAEETPSSAKLTTGAARAGLHCSPEAHRVVGTLQMGLVRMSIGHRSTEDEIVSVLEAMREIAAKAGT